MRHRVAPGRRGIGGGDRADGGRGALHVADRIAVRSPDVHGTRRRGTARGLAVRLLPLLAWGCVAGGPRPAAAEAPRPELTFDALADAAVLAAGGFERIGERDGVEVYRREPETGPPPVFLLRTRTPAAPRTVLAVVEDTGSFLERARGTLIREAAPLGSGVEPGKGWRFRDLYSRIRLPRWLPFRDREQVVRLWTEELGGERFRVRFAVLPRELYAGRLEELRGGGREPLYVPRGAGAWEIAPAPDEGALVAYRIRSDPGGGVPRGIAERRQLGQVRSLLRAFVREAERRDAEAAARLAASGGP